jgi:ribosomal protein S18 acetylase RimI-like enzyme
MPRVFVAQGAWVDAAFQRLFAHRPARERRNCIRNVQSEVKRGALALDHLLVAVESDLLCGVLFALARPGQEAVVFPPWVKNFENSQSICQPLFALLGEQLDRAGVVFSQMLLAPDDEAGGALLESCGFPLVARLDLLELDLRREASMPTSAPPPSLAYSPKRAARFARLIQATYRNSLDCPGVSRFRRGEDAVCAHLAREGFCEELARIYTVGSQDAGVLLMTFDGHRAAAEIGYLGVSEAFRGQGLGTGMVHDALRLARQYGCRRVEVAVDCSNEPAVRLYRALRFVERERVHLHARVSPACRACTE